MRLLTVALIATLVMAPGAAAKDPESNYKTAEAKHFTRVEGVELRCNPGLSHPPTTVLL